MTDQVKNVTERLIDGYRDYFNGIESFDGRYVCGQLFLFGNAKAYDVGMPGRYNGENEIKLNYMLNWFNHKWMSGQNSLTEMLNKAAKYDPFKHSVIPKLGKLKHAIDVSQYVQIIVKIIEAQQFIKLNKIQSDEYHQRLININNPYIVAYRPIDIHLYLIDLLETIVKRLNKDYDGEHIYPSATLTYLSSLDHIKNDSTIIKNDNALAVIKIKDIHSFNSDHINQTFANMPIDVLIETKTSDALVLGLKNHLLLEKSFKHVDNVIVLMESILSTLLKE